MAWGARYSCQCSGFEDPRAPHPGWEHQAVHSWHTERGHQHDAMTHTLPMRRAWPQVILTKDLENVGKEGELLTVPIGYLRNYLLPNGIARVASDGILE